MEGKGKSASKQKQKINQFLTQMILTQYPGHISFLEVLLLRQVLAVKHQQSGSETGKRVQEVRRLENERDPKCYKKKHFILNLSKW